MSVEQNEQIVRGYFAEVVDKFNIDLLGEYCTDDCIIHRPEVEEPFGRLKISIALHYDLFIRQRSHQ